MGDKTVFCDRAMLAQAVKLLDRTGEKIESMHRDIVCAAMRNFVENSIQYLPDEIFNGYFVEELADVTDIFTGENASRLAGVVKQMNVFRDAAREYAERPTRENELLLLEAAGPGGDAELRLQERRRAGRDGQRPVRQAHGPCAAAGKVYTAEQWETHDIQRTVAKTALKEATYPRNFPAPSFKYMGDVSVRSNSIGSTNLFVRDMHKTITRVGYHTGWFK